MQLGIVGLGRMGGNIARRLMRHGHLPVVHDRNVEAIDALVVEGARGAQSLEDMVGLLDKPRAVWVMLPAGEATEQTIARLADLLEADDVIIDGGNTHYKDDIRRADTLATHQLHYVDVGTSGGVWGLERGYCMMSVARQPSWNGWNRCSSRWRRGLATLPVPRGARARSGALSRATSMPGLQVPVIM